MAGIIFQKIAKASPFLKAKLRQAGMNIKPEDFVKNTALSAFYMTTGFFVFLFQDHKEGLIRFGNLLFFYYL